MKSDTQIYLDMDGCLTDFEKRAKEIYPNYHNVYKKWVVGNKKCPVYIKDNNEMISKIKNDPLFWENLEWMSNGKKLWSFILDNFSNIAILTAPIWQDQPRCAQQKHNWVNRELKIIDSKHFICNGKKESFVNKFPAKNQILIDDKPSNIDKWESKGGIGILHKNDEIESTLKELSKYIYDE